MSTRRGNTSPLLISTSRTARRELERAFHKLRRLIRRRMLRNLGVLALAVALAVVGGAAGSGVYGGKDGKDPDVFTTLVWREQLGRHAWFYLHTLAATYPDAPTEEDKQAVRNLMASFGQLFPCKLCRRHLQGNLGPTHGVGPVAVGSREELSLWMCKLHNTVNTQNGKPEQPCELAQLDALYRKDDVDDGKAPEPKVPWDAALYVKDPAEYAPGPFLLRDS